ncbi:MAG: hypothetical protein UFG06_12935 [Lachnospiraceae bacterium]|nr:hypothetical protein [Lachnospiraceae bacterium]
MQPEYTKLKVHNEIELCETADMEIKQQIERILLRNRISYYMKWYRQGLFKRNREICIICVNDSVKDDAEQLIRSLEKDIDSKVKFLMRRSEESFF